jgi:hypothetical protein
MSTTPKPEDKPEAEAAEPNYTFHPFAEKFPLLDEKDLQKLADDIAANGLRFKISVLGMKVLDGRNRYNAIKLKRKQSGPRPDPGDRGKFRKAGHNAATPARRASARGANECLAYGSPRNVPLKWWCYSQR